MLIVAGWYEVKPEEREEFLASRLHAMRTSRPKVGCHDYAFSADPIEADRVLVFERWEDRATLDAHIASMRETPLWSSEGVQPTGGKFVQYDISGQQKLGG